MTCQWVLKAYSWKITTAQDRSVRREREKGGCCRLRRRSATLCIRRRGRGCTSCHSPRSASGKPCKQRVNNRYDFLDREGNIIGNRQSLSLEQSEEEPVRERHAECPFKQSVKKQPRKECYRQRHRPFFFARELEIQQHRYGHGVGEAQEPNGYKEKQCPQQNVNRSLPGECRWNLAFSRFAGCLSLLALFSKQIFTELRYCQNKSWSTDHPREKTRAESKIAALPHR